jgi:hypothetical protein
VGRRGIAPEPRRAPSLARRGARSPRVVSRSRPAPPSPLSCRTRKRSSQPSRSTAVASPGARSARLDRQPAGPLHYVRSDPVGA